VCSGNQVSLRVTVNTPQTIQTCHSVQPLSGTQMSFTLFLSLERRHTLRSLHFVTNQISSELIAHEYPYVFFSEKISVPYNRAFRIVCQYAACRVSIQDAGTFPEKQHVFIRIHESEHTSTRAHGMRTACTKHAHRMRIECAHKITAQTYTQTPTHTYTHTRILGIHWCGHLQRSWLYR
jgi:hypothetical protein